MDNTIDFSKYGESNKYYTLEELVEIYKKITEDIEIKEKKPMDRKIAKFEKVSYEQFETAMEDKFPVLNKEDIKEIYDNIKLPERATKGSAGYDFSTPIEFTLHPNSTITIPTGIRCLLDENWVLQIYPRSGLGFKYQEALCNTVGVIDADYSGSDNEGHIFIKLVNRGDKEFTINFNDGFAQGIFLPYGITVDDDTDGIRNGGFGSTGR